MYKWLRVCILGRIIDMPIKELSNQLVLKTMRNQCTQGHPILFVPSYSSLPLGVLPASPPPPNTQGVIRSKSCTVLESESENNPSFHLLRASLEGVTTLSQYQIEIKSFKIIISKRFGFASSFIPLTIMYCSVMITWEIYRKDSAWEFVPFWNFHKENSTQNRDLLFPQIIC